MLPPATTTGSVQPTTFVTPEDTQFQATPSRCRPQRPPTSDDIALLTTNLDRFFAPEVVQYAKEQSDKWRQYNIRVKDFWERKDELRNPYIIDRRFRAWVKKKFNYDLSELVHCCRTPVCKKSGTDTARFQMRNQLAYMWKTLVISSSNSPPQRQRLDSMHTGT